MEKAGHPRGTLDRGARPRTAEGRPQWRVGPGHLTAWGGALIKYRPVRQPARDQIKWASRSSQSCGRLLQLFR